MGYRKVPTIHTLTFDEYEGLVVRMKGVKVGKIRKLMHLGDDEENALDEMLDLIAEGLVSWNLEGEDGQPIPITRDEIEDLEYDMANAILTEWLDKVTGVDKELGKDSSSGEKFPGLPLTMEAL